MYLNALNQKRCPTWLWLKISSQCIIFYFLNIPDMARQLVTLLWCVLDNIPGIVLGHIMNDCRFIFIFPRQEFDLHSHLACLNLGTAPLILDLLYYERNLTADHSSELLTTVQGCNRCSSYLCWMLRAISVCQSKLVCWSWLFIFMAGLEYKCKHQKMTFKARGKIFTISVGLEERKHSLWEDLLSWHWCMKEC